MKMLFVQLLIISFLVAGCSDSDFLNDKPSMQMASTMEINGFEAHVSLDGKPQYILRSDEALLKEKQSCVDMNNIHLTFFKDGEEAKTGTLVALNGQYYFKDNPALQRQKSDIDLKGNVNFNMTDGTSLKTPEVHYVSSTQKIYSNAGFEKKRKNNGQTIIIKGKVFVTDKNLRKWEDTGAKMSLETTEESDKTPSKKEK